MSWLTLQQVADAVGGALEGQDAPIDTVSTDTRTCSENALFIALKGERFDAHELLADAPENLAAGLLLERPIEHPAPQIIVNDTLKALGQLAHWWRKQFTGKVIGLTGSNGKTTVKEMIAAICAEQGEVLATKGNLNNHIGVPLTLLNIRSHHDYAVVEMGANHPGEIDYLTRICAPQVALLNNAGAAHLEGFGSIEGVASAKAEIFNSLKSDGVAIINADDEFANFWLALNESRNTLTFGREAYSGVRLMEYMPLVLNIEGRAHRIEFSLLGQHNARNAAAAAAASLAAGISPENIVAGLSAIKAVKGRLCVVEEQQHFLLIDDSYNANPKSMMASADVLADQKSRTWWVVGDMAELGNQAPQMHSEVAAYARGKGIDRLLALGAHAESMADAFGPGGYAFSDIEELIKNIKNGIHLGDSVLVKGSRSMRMERVVGTLANLAKNGIGDQHAV